MRVSDPDVTRHPLDQSCETLQLCHDVVYIQTKTNTHVKSLFFN